MNSHALFNMTSTICPNLLQFPTTKHPYGLFPPISHFHSAKLRHVSAINISTLKPLPSSRFSLFFHSQSLLVAPLYKKKCSFIKKAPIAKVEENLSPSPQDLQKPQIGIKAGDTIVPQKLKIGLYFVLWWSLNVVFNIYNKKVLNVYPFPWLTSTLSLVAGLAIMLVSWAFKIIEVPQVDCEFWKHLAPVAIAHTIGHVAATVSMSKVSVSFTHIIKSAEPAFSVLIQRLIFGERFPLMIYFSLLPIIGGCALAAATELHFNMIGLSPAMILDFVSYFGYSRMVYLGCKFMDYFLGVKGQCHCWWTGFVGAMISNVAFVFRNIFSKRGMSNKGKNVGGVNYYACLSMMSLVFLTPFALVVEGPKVWVAGWKAANLEHGNQVLWWVLAQSVFYHLYNQVSYMSLDEISPLTFSIGNTIKRVTVIVSSILIFRTKILPINILGAAIAIWGTFLYSQIKQ